MMLHQLYYNSLYRKRVPGLDPSAISYQKEINRNCVPPTNPPTDFSANVCGFLFCFCFPLYCVLEHSKMQCLQPLIKHGKIFSPNVNAMRKQSDIAECATSNFFPRRIKLKKKKNLPLFIRHGKIMW